jgi:hypothetical protein
MGGDGRTDACITNGGATPLAGRERGFSVPSGLRARISRRLDTSRRQRADDHHRQSSRLRAE